MKDLTVSYNITVCNIAGLAENFLNRFCNGQSDSECFENVIFLYIANGVILLEAWCLILGMSEAAPSDLMEIPFCLTERYR